MGGMKKPIASAWLNYKLGCSGIYCNKRSRIAPHRVSSASAINHNNLFKSQGNLPWLLSFLRQ
jgi:hypothetical protein